VVQICSFSVVKFFFPVFEWSWMVMNMVVVCPVMLVVGYASPTWSLPSHMY
jgi:hypothetical protein